MSAPELTPWGERVRERTEPLAPDDEAHGYAHAHLAGALAEVLERVAEIYDPEDGLPGSPLVDVDRCPAWALPWLAQLIGVTIPAGTTDDELVRAAIRDVAGWKRGTPAAMIAAAQAHLTGEKSVTLRERDATGGDPPYCLEVITRTAETPDSAAVLAALRRQKPAGLVLTYRTVVGYDWQGVDVDYARWGDLDTAYSTWRRVVNKEPG